MAAIIFVTQEGQIGVEKAPVNGRYIEMRDGYHPLTNDSYWQDEKRRGPAALLIFENVLGAHGSKMAEQDVKALLTEAVLITRLHKKLQINRRWMRVLAQLMEWFKKYGIMVVIFAMIAYYAGNAMLQGAV